MRASLQSDITLFKKAHKQEKNDQEKAELTLALCLQVCKDY